MGHWFQGQPEQFANPARISGHLSPRPDWRLSVAKVSPYHTITEEKPEQRDVYHDHSDCPDGKRIKPENRRTGTAGRPRCDECKRLG